MKQTYDCARKSCKMQSKERIARKAAIQAKVERGMHIVGGVMIALTVLVGFTLGFYPKVFGLQTSNPAIGFAIAILAGIRLWALRIELKRERQANA
jgi:hypothetical protein